MEPSNQIKEVLSRHKSRLLEQYPIEALALFGSSARGDFRPESDVDILVVFNGKVGLRFVDLADELENILGKPVDLVSKNAIKPGYFDSIKKDLIYV